MVSAATILFLFVTDRGTCELRIRLTELEKAPVTCAFPDTFGTLSFPCAGGAGVLTMGKLEMNGRVGAAGSIDLEIEPTTRLKGHLKGEMIFTHEKDGCRVRAKAVSERLQK